MSGLRQAALVLHGLAPADRDWVLEQLPAARAGEVQALLDELRQLGIPADPTLIGRAVTPSPAEGDEGELPWRCIADARADELRDLLRREPHALVALVAMARPAQRPRGPLARLGLARATEAAGQGGGRGGPALRRAVLDEVARRLVSAPSTCSAASRPSRSRRRTASCKPWWSAWIR